MPNTQPELIKNNPKCNPSNNIRCNSILSNSKDNSKRLPLNNKLHSNNTKLLLNNIRPSPLNNRVQFNNIKPLLNNTKPLPNNNRLLPPNNSTMDLDSKTLEFALLTVTVVLENAALNGDSVELDLPSVDHLMLLPWPKDNKLLPLNHNTDNNLTMLNPNNNTKDLNSKELDCVHLTLNAELENAALNGDSVELDLPSVDPLKLPPCHMDNKLLPLKCNMDSKRLHHKCNMDNNLTMFPDNNHTLNLNNNTMDLDNKTLEFVLLTLNAELENAALNGDSVELDLLSVDPHKLPR
jgi:hypothetical protein